MTVDQILEQVWQLPWYDVFLVAVADDAIFIAKLWRFWIGLAFGGFLVWAWATWKLSKKNLG